ncbi:hypothetical protein [Tropicimonas sp. IMCC34043]|nr:hypothetical protein [Tropicimonas sp. IMCC34043]
MTPLPADVFDLWATLFGQRAVAALFVRLSPVSHKFQPRRS